MMGSADNENLLTPIREVSHVIEVTYTSISKFGGRYKDETKTKPNGKKG
jgi:hypothetical protein